MPDAKPHLLIVDDETDMRTLLGQIFSRLGYKVRVAEDGFRALEQLREQRPDILVSDLNMPHMSGFELLSVVRRRMPDIYVVAISGAFSGREVPTGIAADAFHEKSTGVQNLLGLVKVASSSAALPRAGSSASVPIWICPERIGSTAEAQVLLTCPDCLRAFSLTVGPADFVIHQASCIYCNTQIHYATEQPMNVTRPHSFQAHGEAPAQPTPQQNRNTS